MDSGKVYVSRKKRLLAELRAIGSTPFEVTSPKGWAGIASKLCAILNRFDLGEKVDDVVTDFLAYLETTSEGVEEKKAKFYKVMCFLYSVADEFRDYSS